MLFFFSIIAVVCGSLICHAELIRDDWGSRSVYDKSSKIIEKKNHLGVTVWRSSPVEVRNRTGYDAAIDLEVLDRVPGAIASVRLLMLNEDKLVIDSVSEFLPGYQVLYATGKYTITRRSPVDHGARYMCLEILLAGNPVTVQIDSSQIRIAEKRERFKGIYTPKAPYPDREKVLSSLKKITPATAKVVRRNGRVVVLLDGREAVLKSYKGSIDYKEFGQSGMNLLFSFNAGITLWWDKMTWDMSPYLGNGNFDFTRLENELLFMHDAAPNARVLLNIDVDGGPEFYTRYPDSIFRNEKGELGIRSFMAFGGFGGAGPDPAKHRHYAISYSSEDYQRYVCQGLRKVARFLKQSPAGKIVAGFGIAGGHDGQFFQWEYNCWRGQADYSPAAIKAYRKWLKKKYKTDDALQRAWEDQDVTLEEAPLFSEDEWKSRPFWSAGKTGLDRKIADGREFSSVSLAEMNKLFARTLKQEMGRDIIVGTYYSSPLWGQTARSHLHELTGENGIDAVFQVSNYSFCRCVGGYGASGNFAIAAAHSAGLLFCQEMDHRTPRSEITLNESVESLGRAASNQEFRDQILRDAGSVLAYGGDGFFYFDMYDSWYADAASQNAISATYRAADFVVKNRARVPGTRVALFTDEKERLLTRYPSFGAAGLDKVSRISGITPDIYLLEDLTRNIPDYRFWIIADPRTLTAAQLEALRKKAFRKGNVILITGSAGAFQATEAGSARDTLAKLGIKVRDRLYSISDFTSFVENANDPLLDKCIGRSGLLNLTFDRSGTLTCSELPFTTVLDDPDFKVLAVWNASKEAALGVKRTEHGTIVYSAHPAGVSAQFLNNCAREAGITPHSEAGNMVSVGHGAIAVHRLAQEVVLNFEQEMEFFDPETGRNAGRGKTLKVECEVKRSRLLNYRPVVK